MMTEIDEYLDSQLPEEFERSEDWLIMTATIFWNSGRHIET